MRNDYRSSRSNMIVMIIIIERHFDWDFGERVRLESREKTGHFLHDSLKKNLGFTI